jgi:type VI secretion system protein ImpC
VTEPEQKAAKDAAADVGEFAYLLQKEFRPKTSSAQAELEGVMRTLAHQALAPSTVISDDVVTTIKAIIAEIDKKLSDQLNLIMHHPRFQQLEGAWRGLYYLVSNTETDTTLKIRVMNVSKRDFAANLAKPSDSEVSSSWEDSAIFKKIYQQEYGQLGGEPYGCLVGDYYFDHSPEDVMLLGQVAQMAAAANAPFIAGAAPTLLNMDSWRELANTRDLGPICRTPDHATWRSLRDSDDAKYVGLVMPRFLARLPYGATMSPVEEFGFEEDTNEDENGCYVWANSAYAFAVNINRSFKMYGWCASIRGVESGGAVEGLPLHAFPSDDGGIDLKCPTEIAISDRREAELAALGLIPLIHRKNTDVAAFIGAQSLQRPAEYSDPNATANARISARLPYLFACSRFVQILKCIVRDKAGALAERADIERYLADWLKGYVLGNPESAGDVTRAQKPLAAAQVLVTEIAGKPGYYAAELSLRPHYQLEGTNIALKMVAKLPHV